MKNSPASPLTHSYARIVFVLGEPLTIHRSEGVNGALPASLGWRCGCSASGPTRSMLWMTCANHAQYAGSLDEEKTSSLISAWRDRTGIRFAGYSAAWSFDPANAYYEKLLRDQYLSIVYACATPGSDIFAAELIYRELIGNALRHAPGRVEVELRWSEPYAVLSIDDQWDLFPWSGNAPGNLLAEHGRGLHLVKSFARELQIKDWLGSGHKISAVLPVERKSDVANLFDFPADQGRERALPPGGALLAGM